MNSPAKQPVASAPRDEETKEPTVPIWLIVVMFLLLFWGAVYFDERGGWFDPQVYTPYASAEQLKGFQVAGGPNPFEQGRAIYNRTCFTCHGANGMGTPGNFPPLAGSDWVNEPQPGRMIRIVLNGFTGPGLTIHGAAFSTGAAMVPWNSMSDQDLAAVMTFVRGNAEWGNHAPPVKPEQVKSVRDKIKGHPGMFSPTELEAVNPGDI